MPTKKARVSITMEAEDLAVVDRLSSATGTPRATIISDLLASAVPELSRAAQLIEIANDAPQQIKNRLIRNLAQASTDALGLLEPVQAELASVMLRMSSGALGKVLPGEGRRPSAAERPTAVAPSPRPRPKNPRSLTGGSK